MAAVEFLGRSFDPLDVAQFLRSDHVQPQAVAKIVGANQEGAKRNSGEATQDVEVMLSVAPLVPTWFWATAGHRPGKGNNEPFLRWLLDVAATKHPPLVQAVSYADDEAALSRAYTDRINAELMKVRALPLRIVFFVFFALQSPVRRARRSIAHMKLTRNFLQRLCLRPSFPPTLLPAGGAAWHHRALRKRR